MKRTLGSLVVIAALACSGFARADDEAASTELFNAGRDLMKQGDYAAACPKLAESVRLKATVGALAKLAACEEHEKRMVSAFTRWQQALNVARATGDERTADVERELARVDHVVPKVRVTAAQALPAGAVLQIDDTSLGAASLGVPLPVEPGTHTIQASATGKKTWSSTFQTAADGSTRDVTVPALENAPSAAPPPATPPAPATTPAPAPPSAPGSAPSSSSSPWPTIGLVTAGVGVATAAAGGVAGFVAMGKRNDAHCQGTSCPDGSSAATLTGAKSAADWSTVLLVAGGVLAASGTTIWLVTPTSGHDGPRVGATMLPGAVVVSGAWR